jgi:lipid A oxidase
MHEESEGTMRTWTWSTRTQTVRPTDGGAGMRTADAVASLAAIVALAAVALHPDGLAMAPADDAPPAAEEAQQGDAPPRARPGREILLAGYIAQPAYHRSDVHLTRPDATDLKLEALGWDGDALRFPIDGGVRSVEWWGSLGFMVDFLHNKAVSRLGKGAHGRKLANPVIEDVNAAGTLAGQPVTPPVKLTDVFERLEFTHGHNVLLFTGLLRPASFGQRVRPYVGLGIGFALPHVEVWFPGGKRDDRTSEYQYAGPAAQALAGLEFRVGKVSYFLEYKFTWARISAALSGDESWMNFMMPGDLWRQLGRWWRGEAPKLGRVETTLAAHQVAVGAGYWLQVRRPAPAP